MRGRGFTCAYIIEGTVSTKWNGKIIPFTISDLWILSMVFAHNTVSFPHCQCSTYMCYSKMATIPTTLKQLTRKVDSPIATDRFQSINAQAVNL